MTNLVQFPGLGLSFELSRVAFSIGDMDIYWYGVCIAFGLCLALVFAFRRCTEFGIDADSMVDVILIGVVLGIASARLYYVAMAPYNYDTIWDVLAVRDGGLAIYGGIIAAALTLIVFCRIRKISFFSFADLGVHGLLIGQCIGRWGNFMNVEAYGGVTGLPWRMCSESIASSLLSQGLVDADGYQAILDGTLGVHPTFFYESLWNFVGIFLIYWIGKHWKKFDGQVFWSYVLWYGLGRFWIEGLRTDSLYFFGLELFGAPIRTSQVLAIVSAAVAAVVLIYELKFRRHDPSELYVNRLAAHRADAGEGPGGPEKKED